MRDASDQADVENARLYRRAVEAENELLCREASVRLSAMQAAVDGTFYDDDLDSLISAMGAAEPGSMVADAARALLGIPLAPAVPVAPIVADSIEAAAADAWAKRWQALTPEQRKVELAAMAEHGLLAD